MHGKAAIFTAPGSPMQIREVPIPEVQPGGILVRVKLANICGSDLHMWRGEAGLRPRPTILGHEIMGVVFALGAGVQTDAAGKPLAVGDRVVFPYFHPCRQCALCLRGNLAACPNKFRPRPDRSPEEPFYFFGGYAEYFYLRPGHFVFKVDDELSDEVVAPANCALSEVLYGLRQVGVGLGDTVALQGAGGLGINAAAVAKEMGAAQVIALDKFDDRLKLAAAFGADHIISLKEYPTPQARVERVRELTGGRGADVVVELVGSPEVVSEGLAMLRHGGRYLLIGNVSPGLTAPLDPSALVLASKTMVGVITYDPWALAQALDFLKRTQGKYPFGQLLSHKFPLEEINTAFELADKGQVTRASLVLA